MSFPKAGRLVSPTMLSFAARQECFGKSECTPCEGRITVHHFPVKGMGGATHRDDKIVPLCVRHHADAQAYRIPDVVQEWWVDKLRSRFMEQADEFEWEAFCAARRRWMESRVFEIPA